MVPARTRSTAAAATTRSRAERATTRCAAGSGTTCSPATSATTRSKAAAATTSSRTPPRRRRVTVNLSGGSVVAVGEGTDALKSIANVRGSELGDTITGTNQANLIEGLGGADRLLALNGDDTVNGGAGDDELRGGRGFNVLTGGTGTDDCSNAPGTGQIFECEIVSALTMVVGGPDAEPAKPSGMPAVFTRSGQDGASGRFTLPASRDRLAGHL